jgi:hypothetical protein
MCSSISANTVFFFFFLFVSSFSFFFFLFSFFVLILIFSFVFIYLFTLIKVFSLLIIEKISVFPLFPSLCRLSNCSNLSWILVRSFFSFIIFFCQLQINLSSVVRSKWMIKDWNYLNIHG